MKQRFDLVIAGGGPSGLALAAALKTASGGALSVAIAAPRIDMAALPGQALAIAGGSRLCLEAIGAWDNVAATAEPVRSMAISDSRLHDVVRPVFLRFGDGGTNAGPIAHMLAFVDLFVGLRRRAEDCGIVFIEGAVSEFVAGPQRIELRAGGAEIAADLLVAADGARSRLRAAARIPVIGWTYDRTAIVATIAHERDHEGEAREHFLEPGPFAMLPLTRRRTSIVWTERTRQAHRLLGLPHTALMAELERRFGLERGPIALEDEPQSHRLGLQIARRFVSPRLALIGDAAHVIHPLGGQGFNLGLRDVASLAEALIERARLGLDLGAPEPLRTYERARRFDAVTTTLFADALNRLFTTPALPLRLARDLGLGLVDRAPALKRALQREAAGLVPAAPRLMRGEPL